MNLLPFIVAILLVLGYSAAGLLQKHRLSSLVENKYLGLRRAERAWLRSLETARFQELPGVPEKTPREKNNKPRERELIPEPKINPECARLNLFPLITEGKNVHPHLYTMALKLLDTFYQGKLFDSKELLDQLLGAAQRTVEKKGVVALETLELGTKLQPGYYLALKGTKECDLVTGVGYPPLIDYFKLERVSSPICAHHAHPHMLAIFFGTKDAGWLYQKLHTECKAGVEIEALVQLLGNPQLRLVEPRIWKLLNLQKSAHLSNLPTKAQISTDPLTGVSIRRRSHA